jgi:hypothetical protein
MHSWNLVDPHCYRVLFYLPPPLPKRRKKKYNKETPEEKERR